MKVKRVEENKKYLICFEGKLDELKSKVVCIHVDGSDCYFKIFENNIYINESGAFFEAKAYAYGYWSHIKRFFDDYSNVIKLFGNNVENVMDKEIIARQQERSSYC